MLWLILAVVIVAIPVLLLAWAFCATAARSDEHMKYCQRERERR